MNWKKFNYKVSGVKVNGDPTMPATHWWNIIFLLFYWKKVAIFQVKSADTPTPYMVGFKAANGNQKICTKILTAPKFGVKIGKEGCTFFAIETSGDKFFEGEIPIKLVRITIKKNLPRGLPLL